MKIELMARCGIAALLLCASSVPAEEPAAEPVPVKARPTRAELRDKQYDVSLDARDIERILTRLKRASELSKQRIAEAAQSAEGVAGAIDGDPVAAKARAEETAKMFQEIAKQLEALLTEETPQKLAAARNMAAQLAKAEQQFAEQAQKAAAMMQNAPTANGKADPKAKQPPNPNGSKGSGGNQPSDPNKPKEESQGGSRPDKAEEKEGDKESKNAPQPEPTAAGNKPGDPMPEENPEGTGGKPKEDADKNPPGKGGTGKEKDDPDTEQPGTGAGKPKEETKDPSGAGADGKKPEEKSETPGGGGGPDDKDTPPDEKQNTDGGGAADKSKTPDEKKTNGGSGRAEQRPLTDEERVEQLAGRAADLAARAATLLDILESVAQSQLPEDQTAAEKVNALLKETDLKNAIESMQAAAGQVRNQKLEDAQSTALDVAERFQITTQRLDAVYRTLVGPQAEELRKLEQQLVQLRTKLEDLQTPAQVVAWHRAVRELLDKADELGISEQRREELLEEMKKNGFSADMVANVANVQLTNGRYAAPALYNAKLIELQEEIQTRIQNLVIGEFASMTDDLAPPKYQSLVERYYQVLSREGSTRPETAPAPAASRDKK